MRVIRNPITCPKCRKIGFLSRRWVRCGIYPRYGVRKYYYDYVGHYSPEKYEKEMKDFRNGSRKSRPNGRIWHKVPVKNDRRKW